MKKALFIVMSCALIGTAMGQGKAKRIAPSGVAHQLTVWHEQSEASVQARRRQRNEKPFDKGYLPPNAQVTGYKQPLRKATPNERRKTNWAILKFR